MVEQAARLFGAHLVTTIATRDYSRLVTSLALLSSRRGGGTCLVVAPQPAQLNAILTVPGFLRGFDRVVGWVIDSFWDDRIPRVARHRGAFDHLFVTDGELVDRWTELTGTPTSFLPFGTDALGATAPAERPVDLQRIGRQPAAWNDDAELTRRAGERGLTYRGRLPFRDDPRANQAAIWEAQSRAKFTLAFSNLASPEAYTHPTRAYLTARWTDALAYGATVAGIAPECQATRDLLWEGALLELESLDVDAGLRRLRAAVYAWTPEAAARNHAMALQRLDWRWRFEEVRKVLDRSAPALASELEHLRAAIVEAAG